ncbi:MAG: hypothetical protein JNL50_01895 [Phycisphaerae bacterium]|nr:hypothetical protein [Phycisphaerae bacterium]
MATIGCGSSPDPAAKVDANVDPYVDYPWLRPREDKTVASATLARRPMDLEGTPWTSDTGAPRPAAGDVLGGLDAELGLGPANPRPAPAAPPPPPKEEAEFDAWTIVIAAFTTDTAQASREGQAQATLSRVRSLESLSDAFVTTRGQSFMVAFGKYDSPESSRAKSDLQRIRAIEIDGQRPFSSSFLIPPPKAALAGSVPELDLLNVRRMYGPQAKYTLQVGRYAREDFARPSPSEREQFRKLAEEAAVKLRKDGDQAFYYHGDSMSMVTIGLFTDTDLPRKDRPSSALLRDLQVRFPHNLLNGAGVRVKRPGDPGEGQIAPCVVVSTPQ